ncbi:hypothetical protein K470DRAFT_258228 [Piedraia hortae CBS 480.64]|uniref:Uncharacterized protein n=1 Tax=Piedraia hortae CBS 480.64 TaxID=1314780 RepID=A0A6A7BXW4_9PEZI|nr:hypothetical protein K470DRAFT_258228 [Piedraia hortae CBS 480.64]
MLIRRQPHHQREALHIRDHLLYFLASLSSFTLCKVHRLHPARTKSLTHVDEREFNDTSSHASHQQRQRTGTRKYLLPNPCPQDQWGRYASPAALTQTLFSNEPPSTSTFWNQLQLVQPSSKGHFS